MNRTTHSSSQQITWRKMNWYFFLLVVNLFFFSDGLTLQLWDLCTTNGDYCLNLKDCPYFNHEAIRKGTLQPPLCGFDKSDPIVCCTKHIENVFGFGRRTKSAEKCAEYENDICYTNANSKDKRHPVNPYPYMALIGYGGSNNIIWNCAGSIISPRYILTSARCSYSKDFGPAKWAQIGFLAATGTEGPTTTYRITLSSNHPDYKPPALYNDLAVHRLNKDIIFSDYIRPVCLHQYISVLTHSHVHTVGWKDKFSKNQLIKTVMDLLPYNECNKLSNKSELPKRFNTSSMICAGMKNKENHICPTSYGAPSLLPANKVQIDGDCFLHILVGVTSFPYECGGSKQPGIYTNVANYLKWIESKVWNEDSDGSPPPIWT